MTPAAGRRRGQGAPACSAAAAPASPPASSGASARPACGPATSWSTATSPSRAPTRTASSWSAIPTSSSRACCIACYADRLPPRPSSTSGARWPSPRSASPARSTRPTPPATSAGTSSAPTSRVDVVLHWGAGAYIVGEETALIESLEGNRGMPRLKPPFFPAAKGLYLQPTIVNNVETLSNLPWIITNGGDAFTALGAETSHGHPAVRGVRPREEPGRVRGRVRRHHVPRPHLRARLRRRHPRRPRSSRRSSPAARRRRGSTTSTSTCRSRRAPSTRPARCSARAPSS